MSELNLSAVSDGLSPAEKNHVLFVLFVSCSWKDVPDHSLHVRQL